MTCESGVKNDWLPHGKMTPKIREWKCSENWIDLTNWNCFANAIDSVSRKARAVCSTKEGAGSAIEDGGDPRTPEDNLRLLAGDSRLKNLATWTRLSS